jgi:DNA phosphorothioation-associated putative methyltransferase
MKDNSFKTAISRKTISAPLKYLISCGLINKSQTILDYGCGRGFDVQWLKENGYNVVGFDPYWNPNFNVLNTKYDVILCTYVLNVVAPKIRKIIIKNLTNLSKNVYYSVRRDVQKIQLSKIGTKQYNVVLPFNIIKENSSYCIYNEHLY